jgi:hypothetical protein
MIRTSIFVLALLASTAVAGDARVSGVVTVDGKPLPAGKITFHLADGEFVGAQVKDGKYTVSRVPEGKCKVTIESKGVPTKYSSEATSALTVEVKEGPATFDFDLTRK